MGFEQIDIHWAKQMFEDGNVTIVDIRDPSSFEEAHIHGAIHLTDKNLEKFLSHTDKNKFVICYCFHGFNSQQAAAFLVQQGFDKVYSMEGGFEAWKAAYPSAKI